MNTAKTINTITGLILGTILLSGCYTRFGVVYHKPAHAEEEAAEEVVYYEEEPPVAVHHHYYHVPRHFSRHFYIDDPYFDYGYYHWDADVYVSIRYRSGYYYTDPYWCPPYVICPPVYRPVGWGYYYPPRWYYPPHYVVVAPARGKSPNFGRRPSSIGRRGVITGDDDSGSPSYGRRPSTSGRSYVNLPKDEPEKGKRSSTIERRRRTTGTPDPTVRSRRGSDRRTPANVSSGNSRFDKKPDSNSSDGRSSNQGRSITRRRSTSSGSYSAPKPAAVSKPSGTNSRSTSRPAVRSRPGSSSRGSFAKPGRSSGSSESKRSSGRNKSSSKRRR